MSLALIITRSFKDALQVAEHLRASYDTVEIVSTDDMRIGSADLVLRLETCTVEEALQRAAALAGSRDMSIFVAPGAITERAPAAELAELEGERAAEPVAEEAVFWRQDQLPPTTAPFPDSIPDAAAVPAEVSPGRMATWLALSRERLRTWTGRRMLLHEVRRAERQQRAEEAARQRLLMAAERRRRAELEAEQLRQETFAAIQSQQARRLAVDHERQEREAERQAVAAHSPPPAPPAAWTVPVPVRRVAILIWRRSCEIVAAAVSSAVTVVLMLVWMAVANRQPALPLPAAALQSGAVEQEVPFGAATLRLPPAAVKTQPSAPLPVALKVPVAKADRPEPARPAHPHRRHSAAASSNAPDDTADDVVIIYKRPSPPAASPPDIAQWRQTDGIKHFSDLD